jgi:hypothetical protein
VAIGWVELGRVGSGKFDQKNLSGHGSGLDRFGLGGVYRVFSGLGSFRVGFRILMSLDHFGLRVIRVRVGSGFGSSDIG